jgi:hypothetical protein
VKNPAKDDAGVLDDIGGLVSSVLGGDLPRPDNEDPWERRIRILDSWSALILGVAAVATAWASFQAGQWNGEQSDLQSKAAITRAEAGRLATAATSAEIVDTQTWLTWVTAVNAGDLAKARFLSNRFSEPLKVAQRAWLGSTDVTVDVVPGVIPPGTPMDLDVYVLPDQVASDADSDRAEDLLADASMASSTSAAFVLVAVLLAMVLFFASVAPKFRHPRAQVVLTASSVALLVFAIVRMVSLKQLL